MADLHAAAIRIAARQPTTLHGLTLRIPAARQDAEAAVRELLRSGRLAVNADGTIGLPTATERPKRAKYSKRADGVTRAEILEMLKRKALTSAEIAQTAGITQACAQRHMRNLLREGLVAVAGFRQRAGRSGTPFTLYGLSTDVTGNFCRFAIAQFALS